jgi:hypothetical protein
MIFLNNIACNKKTTLVVLAMLFVCAAHARHVAGGELFYKYLGPGATPRINS